jgi:glycosyltransferase involved in cell wall biosynthesis
MKRVDIKPITATSSPFSAFLAVRNEAVRLPSLLDHCRKLGIGRFYFVDNDSTDSSVEFLLAQPDVHVWRTSASFRESDFGARWLQPLLDEFAHDQWALVLDADELLVYPECEIVQLQILCGYLDRVGARALKTVLIDMYSDRPVIETKYEAGDNIIEICSYFDRGPYWRHLSGQVFGGVRERVFWAGREALDTPPSLTKFPLQRWRRGEILVGGLHQTSLPGSQLNWVTGGLLHFKFVNSFIARANEEAMRKEHFNHASEYVRYRRAFAERHDLSLLADCSIKYRDSQQLVDIGLLLSSRHYRKFCRGAHVSAPHRK